jgi:integration host factor subunit beta
MKNIDLILHLFEKSDVSNRYAIIALEFILEELRQAIYSGEGVEIRGFGAFSKRQRSAHQGINPKTGERIQISEKSLPFFKPGKILKSAINKS